MKNRKIIYLALAAAALGPALPELAQAAACGGRGLEVQVLGSGGPELQTRRASTSYLVRLAGKPRLVVDAGGGSALRFGESGATVSDLDAILFSHLHVDHTADFAALVKASYFEARKRPLPVLGPAGAGVFPSTDRFVRALFDGKNGLYRYLGDFLDPTGGRYELKPQDVAPPPDGVFRLVLNPELSVSAVTVVHGPVPALAWRIEAGGASVVFTGDGNGDNGAVQKLAKGVGLLVAHDAVGEDAQGPPRALHMPPSQIGRVAAEAGAGALVLGHRMRRELGHEAETRRAIATRYSGPLSFADDLDCFRVGPTP
ncbi:MAG TPA: MBL fold metallo-hydrolase [Pseudomonadota bacterium]|nr:MBL fold metallo-hydrolase [Pseudomonadota bacterium]